MNSARPEPLTLYLPVYPLHLKDIRGCLRLTASLAVYSIDYAPCICCCEKTGSLNMTTASLLSDLEDLTDDLADLDETLSPLLIDSLPQTTKKLPLLDKAKLYVTTVYAIESLLFCTYHYPYHLIVLDSFTSLTRRPHSLIQPSISQTTIRNTFIHSSSHNRDSTHQNILRQTPFYGDLLSWIHIKSSQFSCRHS